MHASLRSEASQKLWSRQNIIGDRKMPASPEELEAALKAFRQDILKAFANLEAEISALRNAILEGTPVSQSRLTELRQQAKWDHGTFVSHYAEMIALAHERR